MKQHKASEKEPQAHSRAGPGGGEEPPVSEGPGAETRGWRQVNAMQQQAPWGRGPVLCPEGRALAARTEKHQCPVSRHEARPVPHLPPFNPWNEHALTRSAVGKRPEDPLSTMNYGDWFCSCRKEPPGQSKLRDPRIGPRHSGSW